MSNTLQIKRGPSKATMPALAIGELAFDYGSGGLYIGNGSTEIRAIMDTDFASTGLMKRIGSENYGIAPDQDIIDMIQANELNMDAGKDIVAQTIMAKDSTGLRLENDAGALGLVVDDNGRVGVGGTSTGVKFEVINGSIKSIQTGSPANVGAIRTDGKAFNLTATLGEGEFRFDNSGNFHISSQNRSGIESQTWDSSVQRILSIIGSTNRVGIFNTNPSERLDVTGNIKATGKMTSGVNATNWGDLVRFNQIHNHAWGEMSIETATCGDFAFEELIVLGGCVAVHFTTLSAGNSQNVNFVSDNTNGDYLQYDSQEAVDTKVYYSFTAIFPPDVEFVFGISVNGTVKAKTITPAVGIDSIPLNFSYERILSGISDTDKIRFFIKTTAGTNQTIQYSNLVVGMEKKI